MLKCLHSSLFFTLILLTCCAAISAQKKNNPDVFADVPADRRERLIERLETFFQNYREQNRDKVYDLIGEEAKRQYADGLSREDFLKKTYLLRLKKFNVELIGVESSGKKEVLFIYGCGEYFRFGTNKKLDSRLVTYWENADWYFSLIENPHPFHEEPERCR